MADNLKVTVRPDTTDQKWDITIRPGVGWEAQLEFVDDNDNPKDISAYKYFGQIRNEPKGRLLADITIDDTDAEIGVLVLSLTPAQTALIGEQRGCYDILQATLNEGGDEVTDSLYCFGGDVIIDIPATEIVLPIPPTP